MKFYEKIIGIDAASHNEMRITFYNGFFEFSAGNALSVNGAHGPAIEFRTSAVTLMDYEDNILSFSSQGTGTELLFDFGNRFIYSPFQDLMTLGSAAYPFNGYFRHIRIAPSSGNNTLHLSATGEDTWTGKLGNQAELTGDFYSRHIYCPSQDDMNLGAPNHPFNGYFNIANITTATITNARITNLRGLNADGSLGTLKLPKYSAIHTDTTPVQLMGGEVNSKTTTVSGGIRYYVGNWNPTNNQVTGKYIVLDSGGSGATITQFFAEIHYNGSDANGLLIPLPVPWQSGDMFFLNDANIGHIAKNARACPYSDYDHNYVEIDWDNTQEVDVLFYLQMVRFSF